MFVWLQSLILLGWAERATIGSVQLNQSRHTKISSQNQTLYQWAFRLPYYTQKKIAAEFLFLNRIEELSRVIKKLNVLIVGACDGTHDRLIEMLIDNKSHSHWRGILVEPLAKNFEELLVRTKNVTHRLQYFNCALNDRCDKGVGRMTHIRIKQNETHKYPHWLARQIATIDPNASKAIEKFAKQVSTQKKIALPIFNRTVNPGDLEVVNETVKCKTSQQLMLELHHLRRDSGKMMRAGLFWIHAIKIDAEGRDFAILRSLLRYYRDQIAVDGSSIARLPIIIQIENKFMNPLQRRSLLSDCQALGYNSTLDYPQYGWLTANDLVFFRQSFLNM